MNSVFSQFTGFTLTPLNHSYLTEYDQFMTLNGSISYSFLNPHKIIPSRTLDNILIFKKASFLVDNWIKLFRVFWFQVCATRQAGSSRNVITHDIKNVEQPFPHFRNSSKKTSCDWMRTDVNGVLDVFVFLPVKSIT